MNMIVGVSSSSGNNYVSLLYGQTVAPNSGINKERLTLEAGRSYGYGLPITPSASLSFQPGLKSPIDLLNYGSYCSYTSNGGFSFNAVENIGLGYNFMDPTTISISPSVGLDIGVSYTWEWDK